MTSERFQQYVRIALYYLFGALGSYGVSVSDGSKAMIVSVVGFLATLAWTAYGTRLNALLAQISKSPDVQRVIVSDPDVAEAVPSGKVVAAP